MHPWLKGYFPTDETISVDRSWHRQQITCPEAMSFDWKSLPIRESIGVLLGVLGVEWLFTGHAHFLPALALALATGASIMILRRQQRRKSD
jgi:hypothetical protein